MGRALLSGNPPIEITLKPSGRARRISLRVSGLDGRVTVSYPRGLPRETPLSFVEDKAGWIRKQLEARPDPVVVAPGTHVSVEGRVVPVVAGGGRGAVLRDGCLAVPSGRAGPAAAAFLKLLARDRLAAAVDRYASAAGRAPGRLTLRDTRSRWGSCSPKGDLMFSWRLVMAPPDVLSYVAAHEVAHLLHMHHGPAFWAAVETLFGPCAAERRWLRTNGAALHRYRFDT